jgi:hypothetical protein
VQVEKEKDSLRLELSNAKSNISDAETALASQKAQLEKLYHVVAEADAGEQHGQRLMMSDGVLGGR